ncbi:hypothetical protein L596_023119 [Steinernema carpocapsae]|uniref:Uncharacterized protein n=1 Tax=Steinernema carpocapsae TaxID=34508 RepID=A0A4U5MCR3_STECR|nr:hypothetical protein L596_023119 [Steinernema carpocapsae]
MKTFVVLLAFLATATALLSPLNQINEDHLAFFKTKEEFGKALEFAHELLDECSCHLPKELLQFYRSITIEDYTALKITMEALLKGFNVQFLHTLRMQFPHFYDQCEKFGIRFFQRIDGFSSLTKGHIANLFVIMMLSPEDTLETAEIVIKAYLNWPLENKKEFDQIFPELSTKLENFLNWSDKDKEFTYSESLPNCAVDVGEQPFLCSILIEAINLELDYKHY